MGDIDLVKMKASLKAVSLDVGGAVEAADNEKWAKGR